MDDELEGMDDIGGEEEAPPPPKKKKSPILFIGLLLVAVIAAIILVTQFLWPMFIKPKKDLEQIEKTEEKKEEYKPGITHNIEGVTINVLDGSRWRYFVCNIGLEVPDSKGAEFLTTEDVKVRDRITYVLSTKRIEQLRDPYYVEDSLKVAIKQDLNTHLMPEKSKILRVWISKRIIQ